MLSKLGPTFTDLGNTLMRLLVLALLSATLLPSLCAQQPGPVTLVMPDGEGRLIAPHSAAFVPVDYRLEDNGYRITAVFEDHQHDITLEASVFPNDDGTAEACRDMVVIPLLANLRTHTVIRNESSGLRQTASGSMLATNSFLITAEGLSAGNQQNVFAFAAGQHTCGELHITQSSYLPTNAPLFNSELDHLRFDPNYAPTSQDYATIAGNFYETRRDYRAAAAYLHKALETLPQSAATRDTRRSLTDQLSISYAMFGDVKSSYDINEQAIAVDPTYPYYYYNLACVDAELHNPLDARHHLEEAFLRRGNLLAGEQLPDPAHDRSLQKIAYDKKFWDYVQSLSRAMPY